MKAGGGREGGGEGGRVGAGPRESGWRGSPEADAALSPDTIVALATPPGVGALALGI